MTEFTIKLNDDQLQTLQLQSDILRRRSDINLISGCRGGDLFLSIADQVAAQAPIQVGDRVTCTNWGAFTYTVKYIDDQVAFLAEERGGHSWDYVKNLTRVC